MKKEKLTTLTIGDRDGNMSFVVCDGHVSPKTFNKAFKAEGWSDAGYLQKDLEYIYAIEKKGKEKRDGSFSYKIKRCSPDKYGAKKFTYTKWD